MTSAMHRRVVVGDRLVHLPEGTIHAKTFGTVHTACGLDAGSWTKFWEVEFDPMSQQGCRECRQVVSRLHFADRPF